MIKLIKLKPPRQLTANKIIELTNTFKQDGSKAVWNKIYIKKQLLIESNNKCSYCECKIGKGFVDMHVDHFLPKSIYPDKVVEWLNLVPACPECNREKGQADPSEFPMINPFLDNPQEYFYIFNYRFKVKNCQHKEKAKNTLDILGLNDTEKKSYPRYIVGEQLQDKIMELNEQSLKMDGVIDEKKTSRGCKNLLKMCLRNSIYGACMATILHNSIEYYELKSNLEAKGLWSEEHEQYHLESSQIKYSTQS